MTILVTGANGQLGNEMRIVTKGSKDKYIFTDVCDEHPDSLEMLHKLAGDDVDTTTTKLDITNLDAIRQKVKENDVDVIVNCAAWTNVDGAEDPAKYELVELLNAKAPKNLAIVMKEVGGLLVHISTDYVFGGGDQKTPYTEDLPTEPTSVYGKTKLMGEQAIIEIGCSYIIFRTAWLYSEFGKNFVKTMMALTSSRPALKVVFDQVGTPTYAGDLARAIFHIIDHHLYESKNGIYHYSNEGVCSWFDFALKIAAYSGNSDCKVQPCLSHEFPSPVTRPAYSVLNKTKIKETFELDIPYWTDSLRVCMNVLLKKL